MGSACVLDGLRREEEALFRGGGLVVCAVGRRVAVAAWAADPFEEEDDAVYGAILSVRQACQLTRKGNGGANLSERIVSASREISSSNCTPLTPRFSIKDVKTP